MQQADLWTVTEVAEYLRVTPETVRRWIRDGKLDAVKPGAGRTSALRIHQADVERIAGFVESSTDG